MYRYFSRLQSLPFHRPYRPSLTITAFPMRFFPRNKPRSNFANMEQLWEKSRAKDKNIASNLKPVDLSALDAEKMATSISEKKEIRR